MFEGIMKKIGYKKLTGKEKDLIDIVNLSHEKGYDIFIDYLKTKNKQKIYVKDGKKTIIKLNLDTGERL